MLINNVSIPMTDYNRIYFHLMQLASAFSERHHKQFPHVYISGSRAEKLHRNAIRAFTTWKSTQSVHDLAEAAINFRRAAAENTNPDYLAAKASDIEDYGIVCELWGYTDYAALAYKTAARLQSGLANHKSAFRLYGKLHAVLLKMLDAPDLAEETSKSLQADLETTRQKSLAILPYKENLQIAPDAHRVEKGEVGFSQTQPLGTDAIQNGLAIALYNPESKLTALAHIDEKTQPESIKHLLETLQGSSLAPLQARLFGAMQGGLAPDAAESRITANLILMSTCETLDQFNVNIISADLFHKDQPDALIVDPTDFSVTEAIASNFNPDQHLSNAKAYIGHTKRPLQTVLDLRESSARKSVKLETSDVVDLKQRFLDKSEQEIAHAIIADRSISKDYHPAMIAQLLSLKNAYRSSLQDVQEKLREAKSELTAANINISPADYLFAEHTLTIMSLFVGHSADQENQTICDYIRNDLFYADGNGYDFNIAELLSLNLANNPNAQKNLSTVQAELLDATNNVYVFPSKQPSKKFPLRTPF